MADATLATLIAQYMHISSLLAGQLDFQSAIDAVAKEIKRIVPNDHMDVCIITPESRFHTAYESGLETGWSKRPSAGIHSSPIRLILTGELDRMLTDDACADPRFHFKGSFSAPIIEHKLRGRLHAALKVHGETIGVLSCSSLTPKIYDEGHLEKICFIADMIAPYFYALRAAELAKQSAVEKAEARVREETLRQGAWRLTEALDSERQRIGMELHDQTLADMTRFSRKLERLGQMPNLSGEMLQPLAESLQESMHSLRQIIEHARPSVLQLFGLTDAIETHLERSIRDSDAKMTWHLADTTDGILTQLPSSVTLAVFRIAQEAINNAVRHSGGDHIEVLLDHDNGTISLCVRDNGQGFDETTSKHGYGLENMRTRAQLIAADFSKGSDDNGSHVKVTFAVPEQQRATA
ncbi:MAG: GAF domain-containing sensor histidine kinase [Rhodobacteraceae bacterium]|nr:GAF domain-containing sensor histidine kinase [Paracoccaceae bacterium]